MDEGKNRIESVEAEIRSLMARVSSSPADFAAFSGTLQGLLTTAGIDPRLIAAANQALMEAGEKYRASISADVYVREITDPLNADQKKLVANLNASIEDLKEEIRKSHKLLEDIKKKEKELEELSRVIAADPFSKDADDARIARNAVVFELVSFSADLDSQAKVCDVRMAECRGHRDRIELDATLTAEQRKELVIQADKDIYEVEKELQAIKNLGAEYAKKVVTHLENALLEEVSAKLCSTEQDYVGMIVKGMSAKDKVEVAEFVKEIKDVPFRDRHSSYDKFVKDFVEARVAAIDPALVTKDASVKATEEVTRAGDQQIPEDRPAGVETQVVKEEVGKSTVAAEAVKPGQEQAPVRKSKHNLDDVHISEPTQSTEAKEKPTKSFVEKVTGKSESTTPDEKPKNHVDALNKRSGSDPSHTR